MVTRCFCFGMWWRRAAFALNGKRGAPAGWRGLAPALSYLTPPQAGDRCNKATRRDKFLAEMEQAVPWSRLVARLAPLYPKGERGRPPIPLERMLRVYFVQQWYGLADEAVEDALCDSQALRGFAGIALNRDPVPDATTVLHFRHWLALLQRSPAWAASGRVRPGRVPSTVQGLPSCRSKRRPLGAITFRNRSTG